MLPHHRTKGPAAILKTLAQIEGFFQKGEVQPIEKQGKNQKVADLSVYANFIQENILLLGQFVSSSSAKENSVGSVNLNEGSKTRFLNVLHRVTSGNEGVSRQERIFVYQFWSQIQQNYLVAPNQ